MKTIPTTVQTYVEGTVEPSVTTGETMVYTPVEGEDIMVTLWVQYPSYDFIFGLPAPSSPKYKDEYGFFCFRKKTEDKVVSYWSVYVDRAELEEMQKGFTELAAASRIMRPHEWQDHDKEPMR